MANKSPIRRGAIGRGLSLSLAGARAGSVLAVDAALRKLRGDAAPSHPAVAREARRFAQRLGELKGSYVKIGQTFALLGEHFLPAPLTEALHGLEGSTQPLDWAHVAPLIRAELGPKLRELTIEPEAIGAASLAQVHRAQVRDSDATIALKVLYPDLKAVIDDDFNAVVRMLRLSKWLPASRDFDAWLSEMREQLHREIDYPRELTMATRMAEAQQRAPVMGDSEVTLHIPAYWSRYSGQGILAVEWIDGRTVTDPAVQALPQSTRTALGRTMLALFFREIFDWGLMQTDPNFGNYLIAADGRTLSLLDFGSVEPLDADFQAALADVILGGQAGHTERVLRGLRALGCLRPGASAYAEETFIGFVEHLLEPLAPAHRLPADFLNADGAYCWRRSELMQRAGRKAAGSAASRHFDAPAGAFALLARKLTGVFTFISVLGAEFNGEEVLAPYINREARQVS